MNSPKHSQIDWKQILSIKSILFTLIGVFFAVVSLKGFMIPNHFLDGGIIGFSILIHELTHSNISIYLILLNLPFLYIGYRNLGRTFAVQMFIAMVLLAILMQVLNIPVVTEDKMLIAVFGGLIMGLGVGFVIRGGSVIDGFEVVAHYTTTRIGFSAGEIILAMNTLLFLGAATIFDIETAMYSILTFYTAVKTSNYVVEGFEEYTALTIISKEHDKMKEILVKDFNKAITVYKGERGYLPKSFELKDDCDIITVIVTRLEVHKLKHAITNADPTSFFYVHRIKEVGGGVLKKHKGH